MTAKTRSITTLCTTIRSRWLIAWKTSRPRPGQEEDVLDDDGAGEQEGELQPDDGEHRDQRVAQRVPPQRLAAGQALGPGGADEVLAQRVDQRRAHDAREDRRLRQRQRDGRQRQRAQPGHEARRASRGSRRPETQRSFTAKSETSSIANQKLGTATPSWVAPMTRRRPPCRGAPRPRCRAAGRSPSRAPAPAAPAAARPAAGRAIMSATGVR